MRLFATLPVMAVVFGGVVTGLGFDGDDDLKLATWSIGDKATYSVTAGPNGLGHLTFQVGAPDWVIAQDGAFQWGIPLLVEWTTPEQSLLRVLWFTDEAVYGTLQSVDETEGWLDGSWTPIKICPFTPDGCDGEHWPQALDLDLGPWLGSPGPGSGEHHLERTALHRGTQSWQAQFSTFGLPPVSMEPARNWGPSGDQAAASAFNAFAQDPQVAPVLESGYVSVVWKHVYTDPVGRFAVSWQFVASDGAQVVERFVEPSPLAGVPPSVVQRNQASVEPGFVPDRFPDKAPSMLPSLGSAFDRLRVMPTSMDLETQWGAWGYWTACNSQSCREVESRVIVEHGSTASSRRLVLDAVGQQQSYHERSGEHIVPPLSKAPGAPPTAPSTWQWPDAPTTAKAGVASVLVAALVYAASHIRLPWFAGFSRIRNEELLEHKIRRGIHEAVHTRPGIHLSQLSTEMSVSESSIRYHVRRLEAGKLIHLERRGRMLTVWPPGHEQHGPPLTPQQSAVLGAVRDGAHSMAQLSTALQRARPSVIYHIKALEEMGLVKRERVGRSVRVEVI